jgi:hypothetical protein
MAILTKKTQSRDARNYLVTEEIWEAFDGEITPASDARTWSQSHTEGKWQLTQTFTNEVPNPDPGGGGPPQVYPDTWSIEVSTAAEPIESHPNFSGFSAQDWANIRIWKANPKDDSLNGWHPGIVPGTFGAAYEELINKNVQTFLAPKIVIKHTYFSPTTPNLGNIGKINYPSFAQGIGPEGVDYILTGASAVQSGSGYRVAEEWLGSARGGWIPFVYNY